MQAHTKSSNAPASHCTTIGLNSQNASRPTSAIKKIKSQSPNSAISKTGGVQGKLATNLSSLDYKNLLTYQAHMSQAENTRQHKLSGIEQDSSAREHKKTQSISSSKYSSNNNIQKSRQKSAVGIGLSNQTKNHNPLTNIDYNSHVLD